jgi:hypothetical protein
MGARKQVRPSTKIKTRGTRSCRRREVASRPCQRPYLDGDEADASRIRPPRTSRTPPDLDYDCPGPAARGLSHPTRTLPRGVALRAEPSSSCNRGYDGRDLATRTFSPPKATPMQGWQGSILPSTPLDDASLAIQSKDLQPDTPSGRYNSISFSYNKSLTIAVILGNTRSIVKGNENLIGIATLKIIYIDLQSHR